jgi:hypothetical protein
MKWTISEKNTQFVKIDQVDYLRDVHTNCNARSSGLSYYVIVVTLWVEAKITLSKPIA